MQSPTDLDEKATFQKASAPPTGTPPSGFRDPWDCINVSVGKRGVPQTSLNPNWLGHPLGPCIRIQTSGGEFRNETLQRNRRFNTAQTNTSISWTITVFVPPGGDEHYRILHYCHQGNPGENPLGHTILIRLHGGVDYLFVPGKVDAVNWNIRSWPSPKTMVVEPWAKNGFTFNHLQSIITAFEQLFARIVFTGSRF